MPNKKKHNTQKKSLLLAIGAVSVLLVVLLLILVSLAGKQTPGEDDVIAQSNQTTSPADLDEPGQQDTNTDSQPLDDVQTSVGKVPTETEPILLTDGLYIVHMGNYSGRFVEDGSDEQLENFCAVIVENRSEHTVQLLQFTVADGDRVYDFQLTTLPAGERAIVQDLNRTSFATPKSDLAANTELCIFFDEEPTLYEEIFAISGAEYGLEVRNLTDKEITGPIYVYYKTRTADGYYGGITYRLTIPGLMAKETYNATVNHFWPGSSQVMFVDYAD